jgi:protein phosphatase
MRRKADTLPAPWQARSITETLGGIFLEWSKSKWLIAINLAALLVVMAIHFAMRRPTFLTVTVLSGILTLESFVLILAFSWTRSGFHEKAGDKEMNPENTEKAEGLVPKVTPPLEVTSERFSVAGYSVLGHRKQNQDAYGIYTFPIGQSQATLLVVCDGVGGEAFGERASREAVRLFAQLPPAITELGQRVKERDQLTAAIHQHFDRMVQEFNAIAERESLVGLTTTVVAALACDDLLTFWWTGDSRAYLLRADKLKLLSKDHSVPVERLKIDPLQVLDHEQKSQLTRVLQPRAANPPDIGFEDLHDGDVVMLCSDGVWESCTHSELQGVVNYYLASDLPLDRVTQHVLTALAGNTSDNATLAMCHSRKRGQSRALLHPGVLLTKGLRNDFLKSLYVTDGEALTVRNQHIANLGASAPNTLTEPFGRNAGSQQKSSRSTRTAEICLKCGRTVFAQEKCCSEADLHSGFYVVVSNANGEVNYQRIYRPEATIVGRDVGSDGININDEQVATEHLKIEVSKTADQILFKDMGSDNGSFLSISSHRLLLRDLSETVLQLGTSRLQVLHTCLLENTTEDEKTDS